MKLIAPVREMQNNLTPTNVIDPPTELKQLQRDFKAYIYDGVPNIHSEVTGDSEEERELRLQIYQNAYYLRLIDSLKEDYPTLSGLLGDEAFSELALGYIRMNPSNFASLRHYGGHLAQMLRQSRYYANRPYLAELAQFHWLLIEAFDTADAPVVTKKAIEQIPAAKWPEMRLHFTPSVKLMRCEWNTVAIFASTRSENTPPDAMQLEQPANILVWRQELVTRYRTLVNDEAELLQAALEHQSFSELCVLGTTEYSEPRVAAAQVVMYFKRWIHDGLISKVTW